MTTENIRGQLEIDHGRGVIYFHAYPVEDMQRFGSATVLRICRLPTPIPNDQMLDITHMHGQNWEGATMAQLDEATVTFLRRCLYRAVSANDELGLAVEDAELGDELKDRIRGFNEMADATLRFIDTGNIEEITNTIAKLTAEVNSAKETEIP